MSKKFFIDDSTPNVIDLHTPAQRKHMARVRRKRWLGWLRLTWDYFIDNEGLRVKEVLPWVLIAISLLLIAFTICDME